MWLRDEIREQPAAAQRLLDSAPTAFGCGDLEPNYLTILADAFVVPLVAVRGNHDRGATWNATSSRESRRSGF
jgi:predicted phosphodiesterase